MRALRRFKWSEVPKRKRQMAYIGVGLACATVTMEHKFKECIEIVGNPADVTSPHTLFWTRAAFGRMRSRWIGAATEMRIPVALRSTFYGMFIWMYGMDADEIRYPLDSFRTFNDFFCRTLRDGTRPIEDVPNGLVSPVDATVLRTGVVDETDARVEQVKGATYNVRSFLGYDPVEALTQKSSTIQYVVLYLSPGNYHRIHSPCKVKFDKGRHFCGELLPMRSWLLERLNDVFAVNERVALTGSWQYGQMNLVAVGAANVGNIYLDFDAKLKTNRLRDIAVHCGGDVSQKLYPEGVHLGPGDNVGGFRLGSTVVLVFETPQDFEWQVSVGDSVRVGQALGQVPSTKA
eukprot:TRINITY_DN37208_c0_g1_i1.p1 TRINITY_DN37208_c0_g1~~TRINITY_DN37208_c0_g1_i1.p1  ORF type:complete len:347 (+),score=53.77 TRINITY_DN37208_c0_g1_i1:87-1127(+)